MRGNNCIQTMRSTTSIGTGGIKMDTTSLEPCAIRLYSCPCRLKVRYFDLARQLVGRRVESPINFGKCRPGFNLSFCFVQSRSKLPPGHVIIHVTTFLRQETALITRKRRQPIVANTREKKHEWYCYSVFIVFFLETN